MNGRRFALFLARDMHCVCGCVGREDTFIPQHRVNRGMGGAKSLDRPSNIIVLCSLVNGLIESDAGIAAEARENGWKLPRWLDPATEPFYDAATRQWWLIDDNFNRTPTTRKAA